MIVNIETMKELRLNLGLSQSKMAEKLGVSRPFYSQIEKGVKNIPEAIKVKISEMGDIYEEEQKEYSARFKEQKEAYKQVLEAEENKKEYIKEVTKHRKAKVFCPSIEPTVDKIWLSKLLDIDEDRRFKEYMRALLTNPNELGVVLVTQDGNCVKNGKYQWYIEGEDGKIFVEYGFYIKGSNGLQRLLKVSYNPNKVGFDNTYLVNLIGFLGDRPTVRKFDVCKDFYGVSLKHLITSHNAVRDSKKYTSKAGFKTLYFGDINDNGTRVYDKRGEKIEQDKNDIGYDCTRIETRVKLDKGTELIGIMSAIPNVNYPVLVGINGALTKDLIGEEIDMNTFCNLKCILDGVFEVIEFDKNKRSRLRKLLDGMATTTITLCQTDIKIALLKYIEDYSFTYEAFYGEKEYDF